MNSSKFLGFVPTTNKKVVIKGTKELLGRMVGHKSQKVISFSKSTAFTHGTSAYNPSALCHIMQCNIWLLW